MIHVLSLSKLEYVCYTTCIHLITLEIILIIHSNLLISRLEPPKEINKTVCNSIYFGVHMNTVIS